MKKKIIGQEGRACLEEAVEEKQSVVMHVTPRLMGERAMQRVGKEWPRQRE